MSSYDRSLVNLTFLSEKLSKLQFYKVLTRVPTFREVARVKLMWGFLHPLTLTSDLIYCHIFWRSVNDVAVSCNHNLSLPYMELEMQGGSYTLLGPFSFTICQKKFQLDSFKLTKVILKYVGSFFDKTYLVP